MKCPKCGYLGYQDVDRCRNCGYEFWLAPASTSTSASSDLRLRDEDSEIDPIGDLELIDDRMASAPPSDESPRPTPATPATPVNIAKTPVREVERLELPLFGAPIADDVPLITRAPPPRQPLSVRRATPEVPRLRSESRMPIAETPVAAPPTPVSLVTPKPLVIVPASATVTPDRSDSREHDALQPASGSARVKAGLIDIGLLLFVDALVVYFALKVCRLSLSEIVLLPRVPLAAFLLLQNGGYLIAFTTIGQTLGKMVVGLKVVGADHDSVPGVGRATVRSLLALLLALPAGLGLLPAVMSRDGRGLHDRLAGTRVVCSTD